MSAPAVIKDRYGDTARVESANFTNIGPRVYVTVTESGQSGTLSLTLEQSRELRKALKAHEAAAKTLGALD